MKRILTIASIAALALMTLSCSQGDKFKAGQEVIMMTGTDASPLVKLSVGDNPPAIYNVTVSATGKLAADAQITLVAGDDDVLAQYNAKNGTNYQPVPKDCYSLESSTVTIEKGTAISGQNNLTLSDIKFMKNGVQYMIPVTISSVQGSNLEVLPTSKTMYIRLARTISFYALDVSNSGLSSNFIFTDDQAIELENYTYEIKCYPTNLKTDGAEQLCRLCNWTGAKEERQCMLRFNENGRPWRSLQIVTPSGGDYTTKTLFDENTWYMLSIVYDGSTFQLYINGEPDPTVLTSNEVTKFQRFEVGMSYQGYNTSQLFAGRICEVRVWNVARSKSQIKGTLCGTDPASEGLCAYWKFNQSSGTTFIDETGNGYDMDWTKSQRAVSGDDLTPTPECANAIKWVKDNINYCSE